MTNDAFTMSVCTYNLCACVYMFVCSCEFVCHFVCIYVVDINCMCVCAARVCMCVLTIKVMGFSVILIVLLFFVCA